jgi:hypothetical protein
MAEGEERARFSSVQEIRKEKHHRTRRQIVVGLIRKKGKCEFQ